MSTLVQQQPEHQQNFRTSQQQQRNLSHLPKGTIMSMNKRLSATPATDVREDMAPPQNEMAPRGHQHQQHQQQQGQQVALRSEPSQALMKQQRQQQDSQAPVFSAQPKSNVVSLPKRSGSIVQRQAYRMDGSGINPVDLVCNRLIAWRMAIKNLIKLFEEYVAIETKTASSYSKSSKTIVVPFREANGQFIDSGGIQEVWNAFRNFSMEMGVRHQDSVNYMERSVLRGLRAIKRDIKSMLKAILRDKRLKSNAVYDGRVRVDGLVSTLDTAIHADSQTPELAYQYDDPLLINCAVYQASKNLNDEENSLHENVLNLQREMGIFEASLIENCRGICQRFEDFRIENRLETGDVFGHVIEAFSAVGPDTEWKEYCRRNAGNLISDNAPYKTDRDIQYRNQHHELVQPIKVGLLERQTSVMRNWAEGLYVLTPAGFLHGYKSTHHFDQDPASPEVSIFIPHTNINSSKNYDTMYQDNAFEIRGKNAQSKVSTEKSYMFRTLDSNDLQDWYAKLVEISDRFRPLQSNSFGDFQNRALPPMPTSDDETDFPQQQQQQQHQQQQQQGYISEPQHNFGQQSQEEVQQSEQPYQNENETQSAKVIRVPAEYVQPPNDQAGFGNRAQKPQPSHQLQADEDDDEWDTIPAKQQQYAEASSSTQVQNQI